MSEVGQENVPYPINSVASFEVAVDDAFRGTATSRDSVVSGIQNFKNLRKPA